VLVAARDDREGRPARPDVGQVVDGADVVEREVGLAAEALVHGDGVARGAVEVEAHAGLAAAARAHDRASPNVMGLASLG
jgi:hypothetical protein